VGVVYTTQKTAYQSADVRNVASEMWRSDGSLAKVRDVVEGVVALPTAADNQGSGDINNNAIDIAHAMMGKVRH
jgi:hypothetical protein